MKHPRATFGVLDRFADEAVRRTLGVDLALAEHLDGQVAELEADLAAQPKADDLASWAFALAGGMASSRLFARSDCCAESTAEEKIEGWTGLTSELLTMISKRMSLPRHLTRPHQTPSGHVPRDL